MGNTLKQVTVSEWTATKEVASGASFIGEIPQGTYKADSFYQSVREDGSVKYTWVKIVDVSNTANNYFISGAQASALGLVMFDSTQQHVIPSQATVTGLRTPKGELKMQKAKEAIAPNVVVGP